MKQKAIDLVPHLRTKIYLENYSHMMSPEEFNDFCLQTQIWNEIREENRKKPKWQKFKKWIKDFATYGDFTALGGI